MIRQFILCINLFDSSSRRIHRLPRYPSDKERRGRKETDRPSPSSQKQEYLQNNTWTSQIKSFQHRTEVTDSVKSKRTLIWRRPVHLINNNNWNEDFARQRMNSRLLIGRFGSSISGLLGLKIFDSTNNNTLDIISRFILCVHLLQFNDYDPEYICWIHQMSCFY